MILVSPSFFLSFSMTLSLSLSLSLIYIYIYIYTYYCEPVKGPEELHHSGLNKFPDFLRMGTFIDTTHMKL